METKKRKQAQVDENLCVACGCCVKACPLGAIKINKGMFAQVDLNKCVGCKKCAIECPANVITIK